MWSAATQQFVPLVCILFAGIVLQTVHAKRELFNCDFEDPRSSLCGFRVRFPQKSLEHRQEQWDVRRASASRTSGENGEGPTTDRTLNTAQGSYGYTKALNQTGRLFYSFRVMIVSPSLVLSSGRGRLSFSAYLWTHLDHPVKKADNLPTLRVRGCDDGISWSLQGRTAAWQDVDIAINCNKTFELVLEAVHRMQGSSVAIDNVRVTSMLDLKDHHIPIRVTSSSYGFHESLSPTATASSTTDSSLSVNRSLLITLSGPTVGAIVGIILVILLLNLLIFVVLRIRVKSSKKKQASLRRRSRPISTAEPAYIPDGTGRGGPGPHGPCTKVDLNLKARRLDEDNYIVPDEGFYADDTEDVGDTTGDGSGQPQRVSDTHYTGLYLTQTSQNRGSSGNLQPNRLGVSRPASVGHVPMDRASLGSRYNNSGRPTSPLPHMGRKKQTSMPRLQANKRTDVVREAPSMHPPSGVRKGSTPVEKAKLSAKGGKKKDSQAQEIPLPLYRRKESLQPEIPVMPVTGRRKESVTPEQHSASQHGKKGESLTPHEAGTQQVAGRRKESLSPEAPKKSVSGRRKAPPPPSGKRKESLTPETPTMPLPDIPGAAHPAINVEEDMWSAPGYMELNPTNMVNRDYQNAQEAGANLTTPGSEAGLLNVSQDETGYLTPSGLSALPVYESADSLQFARERAKRSTKKLIHEYHDLNMAHKGSPQYESSVTMAAGSTPPKHSATMSALWDADSDYEELHI